MKSSRKKTGSVRKGIVHLVGEKRKLAEKLRKMINPTISKWDKKIRKKTKQRVSLSNPFKQQKGGIYIPRRNRVHYINEI